MRLYLSSVLESEIPFEEKIKFCENLFVLFSFAYKKNDTECLIPYCKDLLLDSGAFTIMMKKILKILSILWIIVKNMLNLLKTIKLINL